MSGNVVTARDLANFLLPGMRVMALKASGDELADSKANQLFTNKSSSRTYEESLGVNSFSQYEEFLGEVPFQSLKQGADGKFYNKEYVSGFQIESKFMSTNQYKDRWPSAIMQMALAYARTYENIRMGVFRNANNTTTLTLPNGQALASTVQPSSMDASFTQSNKGTTPLSAAYLESIVIAVGAWKTDSEQTMTTRLDTLIVPRALADTAHRINNTTYGGTNLGTDWAVNTQKDRWKILVSDYLTDTNDYFVIDSSRMKLNLFTNTVNGNEITNATDFSSRAMKIAGYTYFGLQCDDWRWVYCGIVE